YLPFDIREEMVAGVEWSAIENVTGKSAATWASDEETARNTVGLLHGTEIFSDYIARVRALLIDFFDEEDEHPDRGGREPDYVRDHMLRALIRWYANVLGKKPTPTSKGPFQNLVADVFHACAIKDDGLERAVERMLEKWREAETKRQRVKSP
ncbi:hypothetical protein, partial [Devosia sp.]|uniref:hypothetical protein n=1 Tax=Devosia sp. TaxID=1871048 RepID=UPI0035B496DB